MMLGLHGLPARSSWQPTFGDQPMPAAHFCWQHSNGLSAVLRFTSKAYETLRPKLACRPSCGPQLLSCCPADVDFALFSLPDSDNDDIVIVTDPSVISNYPTLNNEASCTSNCLFKRSKDDILNIAVTSNLFRDFTNIVALWSQDSVDSATGAQSVSLKPRLNRPAPPTLSKSPDVHRM